jgi:hypothetical protein
MINRKIFQLYSAIPMQAETVPPSKERKDHHVRRKIIIGINAKNYVS